MTSKRDNVVLIQGLLRQNEILSQRLDQLESELSELKEIHSLTSDMFVNVMLDMLKIAQPKKAWLDLYLKSRENFLNQAGDEDK
jgi:hypothetical protein